MHLYLLKQLISLLKKGKHVKDRRKEYTTVLKKSLNRNCIEIKS